MLLPGSCRCLPAGSTKRSIDRVDISIKSTKGAGYCSGTHVSTSAATGLPVIKAAFPFNDSEQTGNGISLHLSPAPPSALLGVGALHSFINTEPRGPTLAVQISCAPASDRRDPSEAPGCAVLLPLGAESYL